MAPKAKQVIFLFTAGAPSQLDLFNNKPALRKYDGQDIPAEIVKGERFAFIKGTPKILGSPFDFRRHGQSGQEISDLLPHLTTIADDIAIVPRPITSSRARRATWPQGAPVISVDTKKRELVGDLKNAGQEWAPAGTPEHVRVHDFPSDAVGKAIPYGVYDMARTEAWVNVGRDHDTPAFAAAVVSKASSVQTRRANHERPHHRWPRAWHRYPPPAGRAPCTALRSPRTAIASTPWCASRRGG